MATRMMARPSSMDRRCKGAGRQHRASCRADDGRPGPGARGHRGSEPAPSGLPRPRPSWRCVVAALGGIPRGDAPPKCHRNVSGEQGIPPPSLGREPGLCKRKRHDQAYDADCVRIVHKHRNLLAHAPERLHEEISADYTDMIYAGTPKEIETRRKSFIRKWRLKCRAVADSLEEAGDRLFTFARLPDSQWRSARTTNAVERLHEEFKRRIKTQTVLPSAETAAMLFWALLASGQITMRKVDGWQTLAEVPTLQCIDLAA